MDCSKAVEILPLTRDSRQQHDRGFDSRVVGCLWSVVPAARLPKTENRQPTTREAHATAETARAVLPRPRRSTVARRAGSSCGHPGLIFPDVPDIAELAD